MTETETVELDLDLASHSADNDNITDWCLERFQKRYGDQVTKDAVWEYMYGVMHAPDWRERYRHDLQRNLPRIPLVDDVEDFEAFRAAGRDLMDLHISYETCEEHPAVVCEVDSEPDEGDAGAEAYKIATKMRWGKAIDGSKDKTVLVVNSRCRLLNIPAEAHEYTVSGRTALDWAIDSLRIKENKPSGIRDDPNGWHAWAHEPFNLIRHLRRLVTVGVDSARIINELPKSLSDEPPASDLEPPASDLEPLTSDPLEQERRPATGSDMRLPSAPDEQTKLAYPLADPEDDESFG